MKKTKKSNIFYVYWHTPDKYSTYSHPELRVYFQDPAYKFCHDHMFDLSTQCDSDRGFGLRKAYSLKLEMNVGDYRTETAFKTLKALGIGTQDRPHSLLEVVRRLRKMGATRRVVAVVKVKEDGWEQKEIIPRKFKSCAALYWQAKEAGRELV